MKLKVLMEKDIGKIKKNDNTDIVIRIDDFGGKPGITIREYVTGDKYTGFTKSGTGISAESFGDFRELINKIKESDLKVDASSKSPENSKKPKKVEKEESEEDYI